MNKVSSFFALRPTFTIFDKDRMRLGNAKISKLIFRIALNFHYLCKNNHLK